MIVQRREFRRDRRRHRPFPGDIRVGQTGDIRSIVIGSGSTQIISITTATRSTTTAISDGAQILERIDILISQLSPATRELQLIDHTLYPIPIKRLIRDPPARRKSRKISPTLTRSKLAGTIRPERRRQQILVHKRVIAANKIRLQTPGVEIVPRIGRA